MTWIHRFLVMTLVASGCYSAVLGQSSQNSARLPDRDQVEGARRLAETITLIGKPNENGEAGSLRAAKDKLLKLNSLLVVEGKVTFGDILADLYRKEAAQTEPKEIKKADKAFKALQGEYRKIVASKLGDKQKAFALSQFHDVIEKKIEPVRQSIESIGSTTKTLEESDWSLAIKAVSGGLRKLQELHKQKVVHPHIGKAITNYEGFLNSIKGSQQTVEKRIGKLVEKATHRYRALQESIVGQLRNPAGATVNGSQYYVNGLLRLAVYSKSNLATKNFVALAAQQANDPSSRFALALQNTSVLGDLDLKAGQKLKDYRGCIPLLKTILDTQNHSLTNQNLLVKETIYKGFVLDGFNNSDRKKEEFDQDYQALGELLDLADKKVSDASLRQEIVKAKNDLIYIRFVGKIAKKADVANK